MKDNFTMHSVIQFNRAIDKEKDRVSVRNLLITIYGSKIKMEFQEYRWYVDTVNPCILHMLQSKLVSLPPALYHMQNEGFLHIEKIEEYNIFIRGENDLKPQKLIEITFSFANDETENITVSKEVLATTGINRISCNDAELMRSPDHTEMLSNVNSGYYMADHTREYIARKEIEMYRRFAKIFENILQSIINNGNYINLDELPKEDGSYVWSAEVIRRSESLNIEIQIVNNDTEVIVEDDNTKNKIYYLHDNTTSLLLTAQYENRGTTEEKYYIILAEEFKKFSDKISDLRELANWMEIALSNVCTMRSDMEHIRNEMHNFIMKYPSRIQELYNCRYWLKDANDSEYK